MAKQRKAVYKGEKRIVDFLQWLTGDFLQDLKSIDPNEVKISPELAKSICDNMEPETRFDESFLYVNKGPAQDDSLKGLEVVYNG